MFPYQDSLDYTAIQGEYSEDFADQFCDNCEEELNEFDLEIEERICNECQFSKVKKTAKFDIWDYKLAVVSLPTKELIALGNKMVSFSGIEVFMHQQESGHRLVIKQTGEVEELAVVQNFKGEYNVEISWAYEVENITLSHAERIFKSILFKQDNQKLPLAA